ncbi:S-layer homology domain-containing protein [Paenibacillus sp. NEAU-GSW1]|uniref:S-layer homology domain-containing protein n=1 Tax=Paenibacillus sp. NEAU-GSW1 TaxID=2682486 RepID=UPI0012E259F6|nr:S-layer homology domain-containing protein [Paenibacillus sp. NEAU-GSW1]MUT65975.1 S-layer homology domain-containing protein [Paenibacillus sp. NEAU-GSW1]
MKKKFYRAALMLALSAFMLLPLNLPSVKAADAVALDMYFPIDIDEHWAFDELDNFINADLLRGYKDQEGIITVKPNNSISRAEFVAILVRVLDLHSEETGKSFTDVEESRWYAEPVRVASSLGIVNGLSETKFGPEKQITRGEIATLVVRAFASTVSFEGEAKKFVDVPDYFATPFIEQASQAGIVKGSTADLFKPFANATRAESVVMLQRALDLQHSNLPEDSALTSVILDNEAAELQIYKDKAYDQLGALYEKYTTGYQLASGLSFAEMLPLAIEDGLSIEMEKVADQKLEVISKTDRFAVVESTGGSYKITVTDGEDTSIDNESTDGTYLLKKMSDGQWKVYNFYLAE